MVRVTTAAQAAAIDGRAIAAGVDSWSLMTAAGTAAAQLVADRFAPELAGGVIIYAGAGNNGGDGYVVAKMLSAAGFGVGVVAVGEPSTADAKRAREELPAAVRVGPVRVGLDAPAEGAVRGIVLDALLGTGATGAPREAIAEAVAAINARRSAGATVVALDLPTGVDANTGVAAGGFVRADLTVTFGTVKRGLLRNRGASGAIACVDIGLGDAANDPTAPELLTLAKALASVPRIGSSANKGTRRRLLVVGGSAGMAGASILAARGALRSSIGMVKLCVEQASVAAVQAAEPTAMTVAWPADDEVLAEYLRWAHCVLIGPGLGLAPASRELAVRVLKAWNGPVVVDADALNAFEGNAERLGELLAGRPAVITPHPLEAERLAGLKAADVDSGRFEAASRLALRVKATVLLKGVPTVVSDGARTVVVAAGNPVLATGGSGDVLGGVVATLLAQTGDAMVSAGSAALVHGRAADIAARGGIRGTTLDDVVAALREAWHAPAALVHPVQLELPAVGESR